jgi:hypothetical protein
MTAPLTREQWLTDAVAALTPRFEALSLTVPTVRVSVGWPGGRGKKNAVIGQCWSTAASADGVAQLFISPVLDDPVQVLSTLLHELAHAVDDNEHGHRGPFVRTVRGLGLVGKPTATVASEELAEELAELVEELGEYPHARLTSLAGGPKKQTTRMLKVACPGTGYTVRMTRKWIDEVGLPVCPCCDEKMEEVVA